MPTMTIQPNPQPTPPGGVFDGPLHLYAVRVYYEDTDLSGIVYHANYLRWFERARSDVLRMLEIDQRAAIEAGQGAYAVADMQLKYVRPAKLDDDVVIHTRCTQLKAASVTKHQRANRGLGQGAEMLCEATLRVGYVAPSGRPTRQPEAWRDAFAPIISPEETP
jgi:acyl-CoA thioester hydrolase